VAAALPRYLAGENERLQAVCAAVNSFLAYTGRWDEQLALMREAESRAVTVGDYFNAGWQAYRAGMMHQWRGQSEEVLASAARARAYWDKVQVGPLERAVAMHLRGLGHEVAQNYSDAIAAYAEAVEIHRTGSKNSYIAIALNDLATAEHDSGDLEAAERDYEAALRLARDGDDREGISLYLTNLARLALDREDWRAAERLVREALPLAEEIGRLDAIAMVCRRLATAVLHQGRKTEALTYARRAVDIYKGLGSAHLTPALKILGECLAED
jgi:tetratricopeptide (TPR) repeat protein